jgi:predicted nucleic acid-binding protein
VSAGGLYLDTSCLLKLFFQEPESSAVASLVGQEEEVLVSELAVVEASAQIHGRRLAGSLSARRAQTLESALDRVLAVRPFQVIPFVASALGQARIQVRGAKKAAHCKSLDRLHLALMSAHALTRLLTSDSTQARAARALGFDVLSLRAAR